MWERSSPGSGSAAVDGLDVHLTEFLATLARAGYTEATRQAKRRLIVPFVQWARDTGLAVADLDEARVSTFLAGASRRRCKHGDPEPSALLQFLEHLRVAGVAPPCRCSEPSSTEHFIRGYLDHLHSDRGFAPARSRSTRRSCAPSSRCSGFRSTCRPSTHRPSAATCSTAPGIARSRS